MRLGSSLAAALGALAILHVAPHAQAQAELTEVARLGPSTTPSGANSIGTSVAIDGDYALVGMPSSGADPGTVYVFHRSGGSWSLDSTIADPDTAHNADQFGQAVALHGDVAVIGAPNHATGQGAAWRFERMGSSWTGTALMRSGTTPQRYGASVAITANIIVVGAPDTDLGTAMSTVTVFDVAGGSPQTIVTPGTAGDRFGYAVAAAVSGTTDLIVVTAFDSHAAYAFQSDSGGAWVAAARANFLPGTSTAFGMNVALSEDGSLLAFGDPTAAGPGAVYLLRASAAGMWPDISTATPITAHTTDGTDHFGEVVALDGTTLLVGAPNDDTGGTDAGSAYLFTIETAATSEIARLALSTPMGSDHLGRSVALRAGTSVVGVQPAGTPRAGLAAVFGLPLARGDDCSGSPGSCTTGFCVDGFCCDEGCGGGATDDCSACSMALTGVANGTCAATSAATCMACGGAATCSGRVCMASGCDMGSTMPDDTGSSGGMDGGTTTTHPIVHISGCKCGVGSEGTPRWAGLVCGMLALVVVARRRRAKAR